ncbi:MAG: hypothetical protein KDB22_19145 [Planctomycetales bacterium]|nr:hypothetical protein [Planctomycetales bacterium]
MTGNLRVLFLIALASTLFLPSYTWAQQSSRRFSEGDEIEYLWGNNWYPGTVLAAEKNVVAIEYMWGGSLRREQVNALNLRFPWEAKAITQMRFWNDAAKQFKVRAAAMSIKDGLVLLRKDDGNEISVPIDKLSDTDQKLLEKVKAQMGPPLAEFPELVSFTRSNSAGWGAVWNDSNNLANVALDPPPSFATLPMKGVGFPAAHFFENLVSLFPIGGSDGWVVAGTADRTGKMPSRILWAALSAGQVKRFQLIPPGETLAAVDPGSRQILTINRLGPSASREGPRLTLWSADPTMEVVVGKKSWISISESDWGSWENWAAIVAPNRILHEWGGKQFVVWDTDMQREVYRIDQESFFSARPSLSPGKKYIALPEDKRVRILESATGNTLASLPIEGGSAAGVGFSPDGAKLAILTRTQLAVWNVATADEPQRYRADSIGTPFKATVEWVDDQMLLIDRKTLYDTNLELPVWNYQAKTFEVKEDSYGETTQSVIDGKLCYAVSVTGPQNAFIVGAVALPGPGVREAIEKFDPESLYTIRPGHHVRLEIKCGEFDSRVRGWLVAEIERNGWVEDPSASTIVRAVMGRSETQTVTYKSMGGGSESRSVTITPYFSTLTVLYDNKIAYQSGSGSGAPPVMFLNSGQSAQAQADAMQKPHPELFRDHDIPDRIVDPNKKDGLGSSMISAQGLTPAPQ